MPQTQPAPQHEYDEELLTEYADLYQIMLYNDDYNTFDYVIDLTQAGLTAEILPR